MAAVLESLLTPLYTVIPWLPSLVIFFLSVAIWSAVGLGPYSGYNTPPEFGDFEAQRHWMELTLNLPVEDWYFYRPDWWKLDYPPVTAMHSYLCGLVGQLLYPRAFELGSSEGIEDLKIKAFMRATVIVSQVVLYVPAVYLWCATFTTNTSTRLSRTRAFATLLLLPSLTLIDHGHFQFNSVMLGLFTYSLLALLHGQYAFASYFYVLALFFKQMSLYYAPVIFAAILGQCWGPKTHFRFNIARFAVVVFAVLTTSLLCLAPFLNSREQLLQIFQRVFPVSRGLWEDKVSNFWCTVNYTVIKIKSVFRDEQLPLLSLVCTAIGFAPSIYAAFVGHPKVWPLCFASCAWSFFLFGFQVHEKSVLLPIMASTLTAVQNSDNSELAALSTWANVVALFSLLPLLSREGLQLQAYTELALFLLLVVDGKTLFPRHWLNGLVVSLSYAGYGLIFALESLGLVPEAYTLRYPDLFVVGNMTISFASFSYFWIWQTVTVLQLVHAKAESHGETAVRTQTEPAVATQTEPAARVTERM